jgi:hypothetical protein
MARRPKLDNTGNENEDAGGFAPGVAEHIATDTSDEAGETERFDASEDEPTQEEGPDVATITDPSNTRTARPAANPQGNGSNAPRATSPRSAYNTLKKKVQDLGEQLGGGKTSMIRLAEIVTEAAQDGDISVAQVPEIYDRFKAGAAKGSTMTEIGEVSDEAAMGMAPAKSIEQQLSKLLRFVYLGIQYNTDALDLIYKARNMHIELLRAANGDAEVKKGIKPGSTYSVLVDVARAQLKKQKDAVEDGKKSGVKHTGLAPLLTDAELRDIMTQEVKEPVDKTGEDYLLDTLIKARATAKGSDKRNAITCVELDNAIEWLRAAMGVVAPDKLAEYDASEAKAIQAKADAKAAKEEAEAEKARKAQEAKDAPKPSKAERQAALATPAQQGNAQPAA